MNNFIRIIKAATITFFVFGFMAWFYVVMMVMFHAKTLSDPLTHLAPYPRVDTFGLICFLVSMVSFFVWNLAKDEK
jgi:hypothetical protein